jgi:hypothetical protein
MLRAARFTGVAIRAAVGNSNSSNGNVGSADPGSRRVLTESERDMFIQSVATTDFGTG